MFGSLMSFLRGFGPAPSRRYYGKKPTKYYKPNGKREVARRLRQIKNGQLKVTP